MACRLQADPFDDSDLSRDTLLGGRVTLWQPRDGYRAGVDPVLLAAAVPARAGQTVLDLGCGGGVVLWCLAARVAGLRLTGVEWQPGYGDLARRNAVLNGVRAEIVVSDLRALPHATTARQFDHVVCNPPYFQRGQSLSSDNPGRDLGLRSDVPMEDWLAVAARRCAPKGSVTFIQRADRLPELLAGMPPALGSVVALPIAPRDGRDAGLVIVQARAGGRAAFRLRAPLILHDQPQHTRDAPDYRALAHAVLHDAAALDIGANPRME